MTRPLVVETVGIGWYAADLEHTRGHAHPREDRSVPAPDREQSSLEGGRGRGRGQKGRYQPTAYVTCRGSGFWLPDDQQRRTRRLPRLQIPVRLSRVLKRIGLPHLDLHGAARHDVEEVGGGRLQLLPSAGVGCERGAGQKQRALGGQAALD